MSSSAPAATTAPASSRKSHTAIFTTEKGGPPAYTTLAVKDGSPPTSPVISSTTNSLVASIALHVASGSGPGRSPGLHPSSSHFSTPDWTPAAREVLRLSVGKNGPGTPAEDATTLFSMRLERPRGGENRGGETRDGLGRLGGPQVP